MHADAQNRRNALSTLHFAQMPYDEGLSALGCEDGLYLRRHGCQRERTSPSRLPSPSSRAIQLLMKYTGRRTRNSTCVPAQQPRARSVTPSALNPAALSACPVAPAKERKRYRHDQLRLKQLSCFQAERRHAQPPLRTEAHARFGARQHERTRASPTSVSTPASASHSSLLCKRRCSSRTWPLSEGSSAPSGLNTVAVNARRRLSTCRPTAEPRPPASSAMSATVVPSWSRTEYLFICSKPRITVPLPRRAPPLAAQSPLPCWLPCTLT